MSLVLAKAAVISAGLLVANLAYGYAALTCEGGNKPIRPPGDKIDIMILESTMTKHWGNPTSTEKERLKRRMRESALSWTKSRTGNNRLQVNVSFENATARSEVQFCQNAHAGDHFSIDECLHSYGSLDNYHTVMVRGNQYLPGYSFGWERGIGDSVKGWVQRRLKHIPRYGISGGHTTEACFNETWSGLTSSKTWNNNDQPEWHNSSDIIIHKPNECASVNACSGTSRPAVWHLAAFNSPTSSTGANVFDAAIVLAHEVGHKAGLDHPDSPEHFWLYQYKPSIMLRSVTNGSNFYGDRQLYETYNVRSQHKYAAPLTDDRIGLTALYPASGPTVVDWGIHNWEFAHHGGQGYRVREAEVYWDGNFTQAVGANGLCFGQDTYVNFPVTIYNNSTNWQWITGQVNFATPKPYSGTSAGKPIPQRYYLGPESNWGHWAQPLSYKKLSRWLGIPWGTQSSQPGWEYAGGGLATYVLANRLTNKTSQDVQQHNDMDVGIHPYYINDPC